LFLVFQNNLLAQIYDSFVFLKIVFTFYFDFLWRY